MLSNDVRDSTVVENEFIHTGDSAIAALGSSDRIFGTAPIAIGGRVILY
jgi:hypothetical protein